MSAPGRWHNAIRVRAKPCVHRFNYSRPPAEKFPVRAVDIVNPGIQWRFITWHTLININNMKFQLIVLPRVYFNFLHIRFCELQKASGITPWKKMLLATALALLITGCTQQTFTVQNKPAAVAPKETITHHFFVSGIGQKTVDAAKICGGAENVVKTETQQTFVNGLSVLLL